MSLTRRMILQASGLAIYAQASTSKWIRDAANDDTKYDFGGRVKHPVYNESRHGNESFVKLDACRISGRILNRARELDSGETAPLALSGWCPGLKCQSVDSFELTGVNITY